MGHTDSRMVERVYGRLTSDSLAKLLSQRVTRAGVTASAPDAARVPEVRPAAEATVAAPTAPVTSHPVAAQLVRYLSGEALQHVASEGIADTAGQNENPEKPRGIAVRRDGIEPPTRGFSVPSPVWPAPRNSKPKRVSEAPRLSHLHQLKRSGGGGAR